ncbi:Glutathione S-transferase [Roseovarius pacificus]|uniref:Glutathione S-transferase n=1 Tax=Roseovarius pacificus TaxID=337701 RepID=A0A1M7BWI1_9RHOB|nr:glutathione S-transferase [Roseovarius pacificus]GGO56097.1 glutathione S-transferase [Roseovarius pacificus]SHL59226.1 Glutathione S-transferase [Roseovarius pacificus]
MKLISSGTSPFVRKVHVLLHETGQYDDLEIAPIPTSPFDTAPEVASANPLGKIPALIRDEGPTLYDSRVICRFLDDRAQSGLYPEARLWETLTLEATADGIMEAAILMLYEHRLRPAEAVLESWVDAQWDKIERAVEALNARWISHLRGPLDMGQIAVGCALAYLDFRHDARGWRKGNDALDDWFALFSQRDSMKATQPAD